MLCVGPLYMGGLGDDPTSPPSEPDSIRAHNNYRFTERGSEAAYFVKIGFSATPFYEGGREDTSCLSTNNRWSFLVFFLTFFLPKQVYIDLFITILFNY